MFAYVQIMKLTYGKRFSDYKTLRRPASAQFPLYCRAKINFEMCASASPSVPPVLPVSVLFVRMGQSLRTLRTFSRQVHF